MPTRSWPIDVKRSIKKVDSWPEDARSNKDESCIDACPNKDDSWPGDAQREHELDSFLREFVRVGTSTQPIMHGRLVSLQICV